MTNTEEKPTFDRDEGWLYPLVYHVFRILGWLSPLNMLLLVKKKWVGSHIVVDSYVAIWVGLSIGVFYILQLGCVLVLPVWSWILTGFLAWRLIDILQAWFKTILLPPFGKTSAPRLIILALLNYIEITVIFGVIGFLFQAAPYYEQLKGRIQVVDGVRASFGIVTPLGVGDLPSTFTVGAIFYIEYVIGLLFLLIIINRVLGYFRND